MHTVTSSRTATRRAFRHCVQSFSLMCCILLPHAGWASPQTLITYPALMSEVQTGDVVFTRIPHALFLKIAEADGTWTNHVGIIIATTGAEPVVAESRVPRATTTTLSAFLARSDAGRVAIRRLPHPLTPEQATLLAQAVEQRRGQWYDLGFNLRGTGQFCSKFVWEVLQQATGESVGERQTFATLLAEHPQKDLAFWKWWFLGSIPWQRETITPGSQLRSTTLQTIFDGRVVGTMHPVH